MAAISVVGAQKVKTKLMSPDTKPEAYSQGGLKVNALFTNPLSVN